MMLEYENSPAIYGLSASSDGLIIAIHPEVFEKSQHYFKDPEIPIVRGLSTVQNMPQYHPFSDSKTAWGFGGVMEPFESQDNWISWQCRYPKTIPGTIRDSTPNWPIAFATSASLNMLFTCLNFFDEEITSPYSQLVEIGLRTETGMHGGSLVVTVSPSFIQWISNHPDNYQDHKAENQMKAAYQLMTGWDDESLKYERCNVLFRQPKWLNIDCPGNACGLDPEVYRLSYPEEGYKLVPHNVDTPIQQLTLLTGIAALHQKARAGTF